MEKPTHCQYYVLRKKRFCRMTLRDGDKYCGEHKPSESSITASDANQVDVRIVCPFDPKHTCYASKLNKHLKVCNAKPAAPLPYIKSNCNLETGCDEQLAQSKQRSLTNVRVEQLLETIEKVKRIHKDVVRESITSRVLRHDVLEEELSKAYYGNDAKKHLLQTASILGLMQEYNLIGSGTCFVEFGAGKGKLSYWLAKLLERANQNTCSVLLIERAAHRHKFDNKLDKNAQQICRIRADIAHLDLARTGAVANAKNVVGVTKHLCGDATDLALRCLINCQSSGKDVRGLLMTFCCHHRCNWSIYTGKYFFEENGLTEADFDIMCGMVSWAVCGAVKSGGNEQVQELDLNEDDQNSKIQLTHNDKAKIGRYCKDLINWGRKSYLDKNNFSTFLHYYVEREVSLENVCIIANKNVF